MSIQVGLRRLMVGFLVTAGTVAVGVVPASAHTRHAYVATAGVVRGYAEVRSNHLSGAACDTRADNIGVYGRFKLRNGSIVDVQDFNGSSSGCGASNFSSPVVEFQAISRDGGASAWTPA
jgi:hypothetical protein